MTGGKCILYAYFPPLPSLVYCLIDHRLADGVLYYNGWQGLEIGSWFIGKKSAKKERGQGGVRHQRYPDWEEVQPPGPAAPGHGRYVASPAVK